MTRWLVTGAGGMLGTDLLAELTGVEVTATDRATLDITDPAAVAAAVPGHDVVVNCAAYTAVDAAETDEPGAFALNATGPAHLAAACAASGAWLLHVSTDYVLDGAPPDPLPELATPAPRSAYGRTKLAGEWAVRALLPHRSWVLRTAWLYGEHGPNFVSTMARLARAGEAPVTVVDDQVGQPTWSRDLARRIVAVVDAAAPAGVYHATAAGRVSWHALARVVFEAVGADPARVLPITTAALGRPAARPAWSVLGHDGWAAAGLPPMRPWDEALDDALRTTTLAHPALTASQRGQGQ